jgi:tetratricopeptide (TPR) repeat protein
MRFKQRHILFLISVALATTTLVAYEPIRFNDFVTLDDDAYISQNPNVTNGISRDSIIWAFTTAHMGNWYPLTLISHILDYQLFGLNPLGHHLTSLLLHIANTLLLFWILTNLTGATWASAFVAVVFALHPVQVESVAWAAERKTVLSGLFWLLTIAAYIHYTRNPTLGRYLLLLMIFALSIMTKPVVVPLPLVLLLLDYWPLDRLKWGRGVELTASAKFTLTKTGRQKVSVGRLVIEKIPLLVLSAILCVTTFIAQQQEGAVSTLEKWPLNYRVINTFLSYIMYIYKIIWPSQLAVLYPHSRANLQADVGVFCALLFILITAISIYIGRRRKYVVVGWLWYAGTLVPMIGLVQVGDQAMADRYMYVSMLGLLIIITWAVRDIVAKRPRWRIVAAVLAGVVLLSAIVLTRIQVRYWKNGITLFEHTLKVTKNNAIAENGYGCALLKAERLDEAMLHLRNSLRINPARSNARINLGRIFLKQEKPNEAIACFNEVLRQDKNAKTGYFYLAIALSRQGKYDGAIKCFTKALELDSRYPDARSKMGTALLMAKRTDEAIACLNEALQTSTDRMEVYVHLAMAYNQLGNHEIAIQNRNKAVELKSDSSEVLNNMAWLLAAAGDVSARDADKAIELAQRACELTNHENPGILDTLAVAFAAAGRFSQAVETAEKALELCQSPEQNTLKEEIENRLVLYKVGKPYIEVW